MVHVPTESQGNHSSTSGEQRFDLLCCHLFEVVRIVRRVKTTWHKGADLRERRCLLHTQSSSLLPLQHSSPRTAASDTCWLVLKEKIKLYGNEKKKKNTTYEHTSFPLKLRKQIKVDVLWWNRKKNEIGLFEERKETKSQNACLLFFFNFFFFFFSPFFLSFVLTFVFRKGGRGIF